MKSYYVHRSSGRQAAVIVSCPVLSSYYRYCYREVQMVVATAVVVAVLRQQQTEPLAAACVHKVLDCFSAYLEQLGPCQACSGRRKRNDNYSCDDSILFRLEIPIVHELQS